MSRLQETYRGSVSLRGMVEIVRLGTRTRNHFYRESNALVSFTPSDIIDTYTLCLKKDQYT